MRTSSVVLGCTLGLGCAKVAAVDIGMAGSSSIDIVPEWVELQHEEEGWIRVNLTVPPEGLRSRELILATTDLPRGRYESLRLVYHVSQADPQVVEPRSARTGGGVHATRPGLEADVEAASGEREVATFWQPFCVTEDGDQIVLHVIPVRPESGGTLQADVRAPRC